MTKQILDGWADFIAGCNDGRVHSIVLVESTGDRGAISVGDKRKVVRADEGEIVLQAWNSDELVPWFITDDVVTLRNHMLRIASERGTYTFVINPIL